MQILGYNVSIVSKKVDSPETVEPEIIEAMSPEMSANYNRGALVYGASFVQSFDGEKTPGEIGPITKLEMNYGGLRARSWEAYVTSEIAKTVLNCYFIWIVGKGLKLQCTPATNVLISEGVNLDSEKFNNLVEARFNIYSRSKQASHNGMQSLNSLSKSCYKGAKIGGDVLAVLRYDGINVTTELIDGEHVKGSIVGTEVSDGNRIFDGIEIDSTGKHIAYHVQKAGVGAGTQRIEAWSKITGLRVAFMVYGSKYRENELRGIPEIATSLETISKIERYKEAAVGSAEERAKIVYSIEHNAISDGSSPLIGQLTKSLNPNGGALAPVDADGKGLAEAVAASTNKQTFNMTQGAKLVALESKQEMFFEEFYRTNAHIVCAAVNIPPNIAFSMYNDSFSASRAATKDWENTMSVERDDFTEQFYAPIMAFWLHMEILKNKIEAPGYLMAFNNKNFMVTEAYLNSRFTGAMFPHIDPLKEVKAEREKLGPLGANIPLTTIEAATEFLDGSDFNSNVEQFSKEFIKAEKLGLDVAPPPPPGTVPVETK